ncbi:hypothetical protein JKP88DRAFT_164331 [Tribonema minus]|uniref:TLC domain-containing protein n=1 Tax=Tribonema minus TaxID=303371 RepID=A0A836CDT2_9STRA|nr:hypothetical protein JKP88DRAFT_164331 [Tribonema minus]
MSDQIDDALIAAAAFVAFWLLFIGTWWLSTRYGQYGFEQYTAKEKAEWCARISSTVHASIVVPGVIACLIENKWSSDSIAFTSPAGCRAIFSVSIGYFLQDLGALIWWRLQHWQATAFVAHHLVALTPYCINNFVSGCHCGNYVLALFLLVEIPTLPLNCVGTLDQLGLRQSHARYLCFLVMYSSWFLARVLLPVYLLIVLYEIIIPSWYSDRGGAQFAVCVVPSAVCANVIAFACFYIFLAQLSLDLFHECIGDRPNLKTLQDDSSRSPVTGRFGGLEPALRALEGGGGSAANAERLPLLGHRALAAQGGGADDDDDSSSDDEFYGESLACAADCAWSSKSCAVRGVRDGAQCHVVC